MTLDTADPAIATTAKELAVPAGSVSLPAREDVERARAIRDVWRALWSSRLLVWAAGVATVLVAGLGPTRHAFNPPGVTHGFGRLGDILAAPAARWDAAWYLVIAHYGYRPDLGAFTVSRAAFFPLYPLAVSGLEGLGAQPVIAGVLISVAALAIALYGLHRLTTLEVARLRRAGRDVGNGFGRRLRVSVDAAVDPRDVARLAVALTAFAPMAFYFSAVYSESLYLALSVWVFLSARRGQWRLVAVLGTLAAATRNTGVLLVVPAVLLYLYGPRDDRPPDRPAGDDALPDRGAHLGGSDRGAHMRLPAFVGKLRPRYRLRTDALWLVLMPAGLAMYMAHLALAGGSALAPFHAQAVWDRQFAGPFAGVWDGAKAALEGARQLISMQRVHLYFPAGGGSPFINAGHNLMLFAFLLLAIPATVGAARVLPFAYGAYVLAALALPLSYPPTTQPLMSLPRFLLVLFPLNMWLGLRLLGHPRARTIAFCLSVVALAFFTAEFSTWHWVA